MQQNLRHADALAIAAREFVNALFDDCLEAALANHGVDPPHQHAVRQASSFAEKAQQLPRRHLGIERTVLG